MNIYRTIRKKLWQMSLLNLKTGSNITRYTMYKKLADICKELVLVEGKVLTVGDSTSMLSRVGISANDVTIANYPQENILSLSFEDNTFDIVVSDQVLEHIEGDPFTAISEIKRVLKPGGIAIHTTCFINPIHAAPSDFWRFTPNALSLLHKDWHEVIAADGWGNQQVWDVVKDGIRGFNIPDAKWHPLNKIAVKNDPLWPIVTWVVARK